MNLIIKNGRVLDPANAIDGVRDLYVKDGVIAAVCKEGETYDLPGADVIDAKGMYVMPGLIDLHVHFREPGFEYKETIETGSKSCAKGGFTGVCPMPNTKPKENVGTESVPSKCCIFFMWSMLKSCGPPILSNSLP